MACSREDDVANVLISSNEGSVSPEPLGLSEVSLVCVAFMSGSMKEAWPMYMLIQMKRVWLPSVGSN